MCQDFLQKIKKTYPNSWVINLVSQDFDLEKMAKCSEILASVFGKSTIISQKTLVNPLDWHALNNDNAELSQHSQTSPATTLQWIIAPIHPKEKFTQKDVLEKIRGFFNEKIIPNPKDIVARKTSEASTSSTASEFDEANMIVGEGITHKNLAIDINVMPIEKFCRPHKLALFDMDSTLIEQEVIVELAKKAGIGEQVNDITESAMRGEIDFSESFTRRVGLLKGLSKDVLDEIIRDNITFSLGAKRLITALKHNGYHVVLVSGGFTYFAQFVQKELGIDEIYANDLDIVDGKLTGQITSPIVDGAKKAEILQAVAQRLHIDLNETVAVGDGANDLPMLGLADIGVAYRAKPIVQAQADYAVNVAGLDGVMAILGLG